MFPNFHMSSLSSKLRCMLQCYRCTKSGVFQPERDGQTKDVQDWLCGCTCYAHLKPLTAEMSSTSLDQNEVDFEVMKTGDEGADGSTKMHEFLLRAILDFE